MKFQKAQKKERGFTLIELLVVIAIIGILAGIIFVFIDPKKQTDSAKEANILAGLAQIPTQVAAHNSNSYQDACTDGTKSKTIFDGVVNQASDNNPICKSNTISYAMSLKFNNNGTEEKYCLDSTGVHENSVADTSEGVNGKFDCVSGN